MTSRLAVGALVVLASTALATPAQADEVTARGFWKSAAAAATATVYAPTPKAVRQAGLGPLAPIGNAALEMVCTGQWNVSVTFEGVTDDTSATIYQSTRNCQPDSGAGDAPPNTSYVSVSGARLTIIYQGCRTTAEGQKEPLEADCAPKKAEYAVFGTLPGVPGKAATAIRLDTMGLSRAEIRSLVRSLSPVPS